MDSQPQSETGAPIQDLSARAAEDGRPLEVDLSLAAPDARVLVRLPDGQPGRAEVRLPDGRSWAAKHYWRQPDGVVVYEFDEPLPAGARLLVPFAPFAR